MPVASPCVGICTLDAAQLCTGCGRTLQEIADWSIADDGRKRAIVAAAVQRLAIIDAGGLGSQRERRS